LGKVIISTFQVGVEQMKTPNLILTEAGTMKLRSIIISKSKYLAGLQCPKLLWFWFNAKDKMPSPDEAKQAIFDQGREVGNWAKKLFPGGIEIEKNNKMIDKTMEAVKQRKPIFEATFAWKNAYSQIDILNPVGKDEWDIIEVKSSTEIKDIDIHDISFQKYCVSGKGIKE